MLIESLTKRWLQILPLWLALTAVGMAQSGNLFTSLSLSSVASLPLALASGDFNGDGIPDAAVTSSGTNQVSILLGKGDGNFQPAANYTAGADPVAIVAGDFNHDAHLDLAVVDSNPNPNGASGSVFVLLGQGDGTFVAGNSYAVGVAPTAIALGDFNGDGNPDLAVAVSNPNFLFNPGYVAVLLGNPDGSFQAQSNYAVGILPVSITAADFNGDGKFDLAVGSSLASFFNQQSEVSVLLNDGSGAFQGAINANVAQAGAVPISLAAADFNNDGKLDLAVALNNTSDLVILQGNEDGTLAAASVIQVGNNPIWLATADLDGDGKADLVVANNSDATVTSLLGKGDATFNTKATYPVGTQPTNLLLADLNGDGKLDLDVVSNGDSTVQVLLGEGNGGFRAGLYPVAKGATGFATGDFNGDSIPDLAVYNRDGSITIFLADGQGGFRALPPFAGCQAPTPFSTGPLTAGDYNGDGKVDLAAVCQNPAVFSFLEGIWTGNGDGTFQMSETFILIPLGVTSADLNGDGITELINCTSGGGIDFFDLLGFGGFLDNSIVPDCLGVATGDFNGDGKTDLITISEDQSAGDIPLLGDGKGNFQAFPPAGLGASLTVADFDGDGFSDFAFSDNFVHIELSNGDGSFRNTFTLPCCGSASNAADFNGDGIPDIVSLQIPISGGADVYLGQLDGSFVGSGTALPYSSTSFTVLGDFDNNGSPDLAVLDPNSGLLSILLNTHSFQASSTSLSLSSPTVVVGQTFSVTANVSGKANTPTGNVVFKQAGVTQLSTGITAGEAQATLTAPSAIGQFGYTALYTGDAAYRGSLSQRVLVTVSPAFTTTVVTSNTPVAKLGQSVTFTATVVPQFSGTPTGTVEFYADGQPLGSAPLSGAQAMLSTAALTQGMHKIEADYSGDGSFNTSLGIFQQSVGRAASTVTLTSSLNPSVYGQPVTLTAVVTDSGGIVPTGSVVFAEGATVYGTIPLNAGSAQIALPVLTVGTHRIAAQYGGDSWDSPAKAVLAEVVNGAPSTTTISSSVEPSNFGQNVIFTAIVASSNGTPDGTVTFKNGSVALGTVTLSGGQTQLSVSTLNGGPHTITALYSGSSEYARSSGSTAQIVEPAATTMTITSSLNPAPAGQTVTFTAVVTSASGPTPTGNVTFRDGAAVLGNVALVNGQAQFSTSTLATGTHTITAVFNGSANFAASQGSLSQVIQ